MIEELHCSNFEDRAILYAAGELADADRAAVDAHVLQCSDCAAVLSREMRLRNELASRVQPANALDGSELLLARCRSELFEGLDDAAAQPQRFWRSLLAPWRGAAFRQTFAFHPGWSAAALLLVGALAGTAARDWYWQGTAAPPIKAALSILSPAALIPAE